MFKDDQPDESFEKLNKKIKPNENPQENEKLQSNEKSKVES